MKQFSVKTKADSFPKSIYKGICGDCKREWQSLWLCGHRPNIVAICFVCYVKSHKDTPVRIL
jgi:hypothetical protein